MNKKNPIAALNLLREVPIMDLLLNVLHEKCNVYRIVTSIKQGIIRQRLALKLY